MSGFYELSLPRIETAEPNRGKWFVIVDIGKTKFRGCLLNSSSAVEEISILGQDNTRFYFNTLVDAHESASRYYNSYYNSYGIIYPHQDAWERAILDSGITKTPTIKSQIMRFK